MTELTEWGSPMRRLPDGRVITLEQMLFNLRLTLSTPQDWQSGCVTRAWCYHDPMLAHVAFASWDGNDMPEGWFKDVMAGTYQHEYEKAE